MTLCLWLPDGRNLSCTRFHPGPLENNATAADFLLTCRFMPIDPPTPTERLAVCSWSLLPTDPHNLVAKLRLAGIHRVQLALDPLRETPAVWGDAGRVLAQANITIVSGMFGCVGEDYSTLDSIRATGGIVPDPTWDQNLKNIQAIVEIAAALDLKLVTFHAGFIPHSPADPGFPKMLKRLTSISELFAAEGIAVGLETGQETAVALAGLLDALPIIGDHLAGIVAGSWSAADPAGRLSRRSRRRTARRRTGIGHLEHAPEHALHRGRGLLHAAHRRLGARAR